MSPTGTDEHNGNSHAMQKVIDGLFTPDVVKSRPLLDAAMAL